MVRLVPKSYRPNPESSCRALLRHHLHDAHPADRRRRPADRPYFLGGKLDRREIVATKAICQIFGHAAKLVYFGALIDQAASLDPIIAVLAVSARWSARRCQQVLEAMTDQQYRRWANGIITAIAGYYVIHGTSWS